MLSITYCNYNENDIEELLLDFVYIEAVSMDIEFSKKQMRKFEIMINTADEKLAEELIASDAKFITPASSEPLVGGKGYLSLVYFMRSGFPDIQWHLDDMAAEKDKVAVSWICVGTHTKKFMGKEPTESQLKARFMNFYYFNNEGKIINDIAAEGMIAILRTLGLSC